MYYCRAPSSEVNGTCEIPRVCFSALAVLGAQLKLGRVFRCLSRWTETRWFQKGGSRPTCSWACRFQVSSGAMLEKVLGAAASLASGYICLLYNYIFSSSVLLTDSSLVEAIKKLWLLWQDSGSSCTSRELPKLIKTNQRGTSSEKKIFHASDQDLLKYEFFQPCFLK